MEADREARSAPQPYQAPRLTVLGTLAELTKGANPTTTDGILPGSQT